MPKYVSVGATALFAGILCATPVSLRFSPEGNVSLSLNNASAEIGRPLTATSVAGVHRRHARRAYRRGYYGYGENYQPYRYGYGTYQQYSNYGYGSYRPWSGFGWNQTYAYQPGTYEYGSYRPRYGFGWQPYDGYGFRRWTQF